MAIEAGGEENLGHSKKDHLNYCTRLKMKQIEGGDAQAVTDIMYLELEGDPNFFFRFRLDEKGKLRSLFWRDSMMIEYYGIFGDIVVFDTTYRTNRYNLICAPIVGINNHWNNCMFGCAFIGDEKIESFVWLLQTFKKSMGGKKSNINLYRSRCSNEQCHQSGLSRFKTQIMCMAFASECYYQIWGIETRSNF
ncbi:protein FAR1-RELATED SEQUENCE 5-like [Spinacia oleracea]|uniref:Protein FAR1-RELATED SEQUENCE 5-like n=1 Tax=Spinacia oleracea TaxID=3562 RepID=A0ABM3RB58_SPIOL|nr:protein FAR1-RELATED SEQUENCE 5-like [Spinacia oleracea]